MENIVNFSRSDKVNIAVTIEIGDGERKGG